MAYASKDLSVLAYANGFTLWHYTTHDLAADVNTIGYFNGGTDLLRVGDMLLVNASIDGSLSVVVLIVSTNTGDVVGVTNLTPDPALTITTPINRNISPPAVEVA